VHITVWRDGKAVRDFVMGRYGASEGARAALQELVDYLNSEARAAGSLRFYELSELGEDVNRKSESVD
jgi:hypothetical protein